MRGLNDGKSLKIRDRSNTASEMDPGVASSRGADPLACGQLEPTTKLSGKASEAVQTISPLRLCFPQIRSALGHDRVYLLPQSLFQCGMYGLGRTGRRYQEQIQIITTAIGKPIASVAAIVDAKANSKSSSGCALSSPGMAYSINWKAKKPSPWHEAINGFSAHARCDQKPPANEGPKMVNETLTR